MTTQDIIDEIKLRANEAQEALQISEANGYEDYDYHEGRYEAYSALVGMLESHFFAGSPVA
jgi:phosphoserine phosphatase